MGRVRTSWVLRERADAATSRAAGGLYAEGLKRIALSGENDLRRYLLVECLEAYIQLDEAQKEQVQALLHTETYQEVESLMKTTYERGIEDGIERGIERGIDAALSAVLSAALSAALSAVLSAAFWKASGGWPATDGSEVRPVVCRNQATRRGAVAGSARPASTQSSHGAGARRTATGTLTRESSR